MSPILEATKSRRSTLMKKYIFFLTTILTGGSVYFIYWKNVDFVLIGIGHEVPLEGLRYDIGDANERYTIHTKGCSIPAMKPLDDSISDMVKFPSELKRCPNSESPLLGYDANLIWIKKHNINFYYNTTDSNEVLSCCYQSFNRPDSVENIFSTVIDNRVKYDTCRYFKDSVTVQNEFVRVICSVNQKSLYEQYFVFTPRKKFISHDNKKEMPEDQVAYNVLILGIDSVSRLNFHRTMPKTASYLKNKGGVELLGYNKVGDNTFPNLVPMLMGIKEDELKKTCLPHDEASFDNCPFVWEWYKQAGYYTALGEDTSWLGTFNYVKIGFTKTPTDYYLHTFMHEAEKNVGRIKDFNAYLCMQDRYFYKVLLDYIGNLTTALVDKKLFGFFWEVSMTHDYLNYPLIIDEDYFDLFYKLEKSGYMDKTIIILASDHGMRWGEIRSTKQGRLEERLPFIFVLTPESFQNTYKYAYKNLKLNSHRLTTPFDIHATLTDLIDLGSISNNKIVDRSKNYYANSRSISLFVPIPDNRTCSTVGIADHWCTCLREAKLSTNHTLADDAATNLVKLINAELQEYPQCATLVFSDLLYIAELEAGNGSRDRGIQWRDFMIVIKTTPGEAIFEATLRRTGKTWSLMGTPSRLNLYGDQSRCVDNAQLKLYCYCDNTNLPIK